MPEQKNLMERSTVPLGLSGPFFALCSGLSGRCRWLRSWTVCPLLAPVCVPLFLLLPSLGAVWIKRAVRPRPDGLKAQAGQGGLVPPGVRPRAALGFRYHLILEIVWLALLFLIYEYLSYKTGVLLEIYMRQAGANHQLQIATPEQMRFSHALLQSFRLAGAVMILGFVSLATAALALMDGRTGVIRTTVKAILVNLPGYLVLGAIIIAVFSAVESYFAVCKLRYLEAYILGRDAFKPDTAFIILRLYLLQAFQSSLLLMSAAALNLFNPSKSGISAEGQ